MFLENINGPEDIKKLKVEDLKVLADETRSALINKISNAGGPFNVEDGSPKFEFPPMDITVADSIKNLLDTNSKAVVLNAATPMGLGMFKGIREEYNKMFEFATTQKEHPVGIRVPGNMVSSGVKDTTNYSLYNKNKVMQSGSKVAIIAVGILVPIAMEVAKKVKEEIGIDITIINPLFLTGLDEELLNELKEKHELVITIEDGELMGGYGQNIASFYGNTDIKVKNYGISKKFHTDFEAEKLLEENGISVDKLKNVIKEFVK